MSNDDSSETEVSFTDKSRDEQFEVLINLVRQYKFIYDFEDKDHKDRDKLNKAWNDMGKELGVTGKWVSQKWKYLREYYSDLKAGRKGQSGQKRGKGITWPHYASMTFLDGVRYNNNDTVSNLDFDKPTGEKRKRSAAEDSVQDDELGQPVEDPIETPSPSTQSSRVENGASSTPKTSTLPVKKRNINYQDEVNFKFLEYLEKQNNEVASTPEDGDEIGCWSRLAESRLRQLNPSAARTAMMQCDRIMLDALDPIPSSSFNYTSHSNEYGGSRATYFGN